MLIANVCQLDELPFLKRPHFKWIPDEKEGEKSKIHLLQNIRSISYQCSELMPKIFNYQKLIKPKISQNQDQAHQETEETPYQELVITTQKQIISLEKFFYLINEILAQQDFSLLVSQVNKFVAKCKQYIKDLVSSRFEINFNNKEFLTFGVYLQKNSPNSLNFKKQEGKDVLKQLAKYNKFYIKCAVTNFNFEPLRDIVDLKTPKPEPFVLNNKIIIERLFNIYLQLTQTYLPIRSKDIKKYIQNFDLVSHYIDEEYLKLQVIKNYPLLRSKFNLPVVFNDKITKERLDGPIFSNSDPDCMFRHFIGYNADRIKELEGNHCEECRSYIEGVQENPIMTHLRDNPYNPYKTDVLYCPQYNRFKLILKTYISQTEKGEQQDENPKFKTQIKYLNYLHMRSNLRKMSTKKRHKFSDMLEVEKFPLTFDFWGRKLLIMDPVRGKNCSHYEFTDLRCFYLNKVTESTFRCLICKEVMPDSDILYLKEVEVLLKYLKFKCQKSKQFITTGSCYINHRQNKVFLDYKRRNKEKKEIIETEILQVKEFYQTLIDPYVSFSEYRLGISDKYQRKLKERYLFGPVREDKELDSDDDFQYREYQSQQLIEEKPIKSVRTAQNDQNEVN